MWFDIIDFAIARAFKANLVDLASSHISQRLIHACLSTQTPPWQKCEWFIKVVIFF